MQRDQHDAEGGHYLITRVPVSIGGPGYVELRESMRADDSFIEGTACESVR